LIEIMIVGVRERLNGLSKRTKIIILRSTMIFLIAVSLLGILLATRD
jgi:hypothetical protein